MQDMILITGATSFIGRSLTRHLVEMQGGKIWFESELGQGTILRFTLPLNVTR